MKERAVLFALLIIAGGLVHAEEGARRIGTSGPSSYSLADVVFEIKRSGAWIDDTTITLSGKGEGTRVEHSGTDKSITTTFVVDPKEVFELLQLCYREHFFYLLDSYEETEFLRLGPAGKIEALVAVTSDATGERVTVRIGGFSKSVSYLPAISNPPRVVEELAKRLTDIASRPVAK